MKKRKSNLIWGLVFIAAGILFIVDEYTDININIFDFWPLLLIIPSIYDIFSKGVGVLNSILLLLGTACLLTQLNIIDYSLVRKLLLPIWLILMGLGFIFRDKYSNRILPKSVLEKSGSSNMYNCFFSSNKILYPHDAFTGADMNCIFGGIDLNLKEAIITEDIIIDCYCVFGGIDIIVPPDININTSGVPIFGGITNKVSAHSSEAPTIYINAVTIFGGVTIK